MMNHLDHYNIIYEQQAQEDLQEILLYYATVGGYELAESISTQIMTSIAQLDIMPNRCQISDFSDSIRKLTIQDLPYVAYFDVLGFNVHVLEIIHGSRNQNFLYEKLKNR
ncbi:MAG: type II toxin-antitoxin system RelE/ParE family toxin [Acinetobacter sp.]|jgi:plasmid stabilization system protein ParE|nr:MAG: type II toxin-antitoxin system RelE/ParE family toxin [Acinetobacter sp.]